MQCIQIIIISIYNQYKSINEIFHILFFILRLQSPVYVLHFQYLSVWTSHISNAQYQHVHEG